MEALPPGWCALWPAAGSRVQLNATRAADGESVSATCGDEYELIGSEFLVCRDGVWDGSAPVCKESRGGGTSTTIIAICTLASVVALAVLVGALYMLLRSFVRDKRSKAEQRAMDDKMKEISQYFAVSQDCVGMPTVRYEAFDSVMRGRSYSCVSSGSAPSTATEDDKDLIGREKFMF